MAVRDDRSVSRLEDHGRDSRVVRLPLACYSDLEPRRAREHLEWHKRLRATLQSAAGAPTSDGTADALVSLERELLHVTAMLAMTYDTPDLGNKTDPVDELVYIILSRRTRE